MNHGYPSLKAATEAAGRLSGDHGESMRIVRYGSYGEAFAVVGELAGAHDIERVYGSDARVVRAVSEADGGNK